MKVKSWWFLLLLAGAIAITMIFFQVGRDSKFIAVAAATIAFIAPCGVVMTIPTLLADSVAAPSAALGALIVALILLVLMSDILKNKKHVNAIVISYYGCIFLSAVFAYLQW